ncbi:hypothetical protein BP6252_00453 [Coleophoma cylindrospora]|uniref:PLC-like phosphodiesterase n=1 Tax=Coleophoma cylindrospora TaxID=1849047 RepID=A0A3D8SQG8_9HELO|nr:hypothetical protein BP6252_00453 [Coleophoma cylindrospora]
MRAAIASLLVSASVAVAQQLCNGYAELCDRQFSNITWLGDHDSPFVGEFLTDNQALSVADQLAGGVRFLTGQTHEWLDQGVLWMCHTSCWEEESGLLTTYLETIGTFLDANPDEVIFLLLTNGDYVDVSIFGAAFETAGLTDLVFTPTGTLAMDAWPTLGELISNGTRLVVFLDYDADVATVPYILPEFDYFFETAYDVTAQSDFTSCALNRPSGSDGTGLMMIVNHFLDVSVLGVDIPDFAEESVTNAATGTGSIGAQAAVCLEAWGRLPNGILIDYFKTDDGALTAYETLNSL